MAEDGEDAFSGAYQPQQGSHFGLVHGGDDEHVVSGIARGDKERERERAEPSTNASKAPAPIPTATARSGSAAMRFQMRAQASVTPISNTPVNRPI